MRDFGIISFRSGEGGEGNGERQQLEELRKAGSAQGRSQRGVGCTLGYICCPHSSLGGSRACSLLHYFSSLFALKPLWILVLLGLGEQLPHEGP